MQSPLTNILIKIFARGFYQVHAGMFLFFFLVMFGVVPAQYFVFYHKSLMLAFLNGPQMMALVFGGWFIYTIKSWHFTFGRLKREHQQFLFYSSTSFSKFKQFKSWFFVQLVILAPLIAYAAVTICLGISRHNYMAVSVIILFLLLLASISALFYVVLVNRLIHGSSNSVLLRLGSRIRKPYFSLYIFHAMDKMKLTYFITKIISWLIVTGTFYFFADVQNDMRVAAIAMLAIITAHMRLIFEEHRFANTYLTFALNMPYSRLKLFADFALVYAILLLPEAVWLFSRFQPLIAVELLLSGLSMALLFHSLLYHLGLNMDKYLQWILGLFIVLFWVIMFKMMWMFIILNLGIAFCVFYSNYYNTKRVV